MMGWQISVSGKAMDGGGRAGVMVASTKRHGGGSWSVTARAAGARFGSTPSAHAWRERRIWQNVLSILAGFD